MSASHVLEDSREGAIALAPSLAVVQDFHLDPYTRRARRIAIRDERKGDAVVAVVEVVSRRNKSQARAEQFLRKSVTLLEEGVNLLVIDLHPPTGLVPQWFHAKICDLYGQPVVTLEAGRPLTAVSYQVLGIGDVRAHIVPLKVGETLLEMAVFLETHRFVRPPLEATYVEAFRSVPWKFREVLAG